MNREEFEALLEEAFNMGYEDADSEIYNESNVDREYRKLDRKFGSASSPNGFSDALYYFPKGKEFKYAKRYEFKRDYEKGAGKVTSGNKDAKRKEAYMVRDNAPDYDKNGRWYWQSRKRGGIMGKIKVEDDPNFEGKEARKRREEIAKRVAALKERKAAEKREALKPFKNKGNKY